MSRPDRVLLTLFLYPITGTVAGAIQETVFNHKSADVREIVVDSFQDAVYFCFRVFCTRFEIFCYFTKYHYFPLLSGRDFL